MLEIQHVSVQYQQKQVLRDITLNFKEGEFVVIIGPNGAGKSSLLRAIAGIVPLSSGEITWGKRSIRALTAQQRAQHIAVVPQTVVMPTGFRVREVVGMARYAFHPWYRPLTHKDDEIVDYALRQSGMREYADVPADQLSGGEQQRVAFARALAQQPHVLLLDETTAHLDLHHQQAILRCARELTHCGVLVIAAMHDINLAASMATHVVLLQQGNQLHSGAPSDVLTQDILESVYRTELSTITRTDADIPFFMVQP
jgi:iron complex transport system ATP-binding protein